MGYYNLAGEPQRHKKYGEGIMGINVEDLEKWDVKMDFKVSACDGSLKQVLIFPAPWCVFIFFNDLRYLPSVTDTS